MTPTTVVRAGHREAYDIYIGRPSRWGNPFRIGRDGTRAEVIEKYETWIYTQPQLLAAIPTLVGKRLGCWCWPSPCHGDILAALANLYAEGQRLDPATVRRLRARARRVLPGGTDR